MELQPPLLREPVRLQMLLLAVALIVTPPPTMFAAVASAGALMLVTLTLAIDAAMRYRGARQIIAACALLVLGAAAASVELNAESRVLYAERSV